MSKTKILIIAVIAVMIFFLILGVFLAQNNKQPYVMQQNGPALVGISSKGNKFVSLFIYNDYLAIQQCLTAYAVQKGSNPYETTANVKDWITPTYNGDVYKFKAKLSNQKDTVLFKVLISYDDPEKSVCTVESDKFSTPLYAQ